MYISDIARKLKMRDKDLKQKMKELGYAVKPRVRTIDDAMGKEIIAKIQAEIDAAAEPVETESPEEIAVGDTITVGEFAEKLEKSASDVIAQLIANGIMANINQEIDFDTATIIADHFGTKTKKHVNKEKVDKEKGIRKRLKEEIQETDDKHLKGRPPVVTIMGHVDHGKTTLLDAIRETKVAEGESGGITQHIGAYQVKVKGKVITFLDTPGHEAFSAMRARGAKVTDVAILVVAADDGVKPQTKEALELIQNAEVPFIVAINKIDKPDANPDRVKQELSEMGVTPEDWGGDTIMQAISAKQKTNLDDLLEMILLVSDVEELQANPHTDAVGTIVEQHKDPKRGVEATVLVQNGTLKLGDFVTVGDVMGTVRSMENFQGKKVDHAKPSTPVQILGLENLPEVGDILRTESDKNKAKAKMARIRKLSKSSRKTVDDTSSDVKRLNIIVKADVQGSLEAIIDSIDKIKSDHVRVDIIDYGVGKLSESDVMLAESSSAHIMLFKTQASSVARLIVQEKKLKISEYSVIYELIDAVKKGMNELIEPEIKKHEVGKLNVLKIFRTERGRMIVGGRMDKGYVVKDLEVNILRGEEQVGSGKITNVQIGPTAVEKVEQGNECGVVYVGETKIKEGDTLVFIEEEVIHHQVT